MTPQDKAKEMYNKYADEFDFDDTYRSYIEQSKQCALIAVNEILEIINNTMVLVDIEDDYDFYLKVKQEIEKL